MKNLAEKRRGLMEKKLKKKNNDMFPIKTMSLTCTCYDATCSCECTATEGIGSDRYDTTASERVVTNRKNNNDTHYLAQHGIW